MDPSSFNASGLRTLPNNDDPMNEDPPHGLDSPMVLMPSGSDEDHDLGYYPIAASTPPLPDSPQSQNGREFHPLLTGECSKFLTIHLTSC